jgi:hypothetical protein
VQVAVTTVASQVVAAAAIASTSFLGLHISDAYAIGVQVGSGALAGVAVSIVYMLAIGRPAFRGWRRWQLIACGYSVGLLAVTLAFSNTAVGVDRATTEWIVSLFGVGGALLGAAGVSAVRDACLGRPLRLAALTITPNLAMIVGTGVAVAGGPEVLPAVGWATGCALLHLRPAVVDPVPRSGEERRDDALAIHSVALVLGALVGSVLPPLYLTAISVLEPGTATALLLATRVGAGLIGVTANSVLLARYSWTRTDGFRARTCELAMCASLALFALTLAVAPLEVDLVVWTMAFLWWFTSLIATPFINREVNAQRLAKAVLAKGILDLVVSLLTLWALVQRPSVVGFLAAVVVSQGVTGVVGSLALRQPRLATMSGLLFASGWVGLLLPAV